jgi:hypothetical protein
MATLLPLTLYGIPCAERDHQIRLSLKGGIEATRYIYCAYSNAVNLASYLGGFTVLPGFPPILGAGFPGFNFCVCNDISIDPYPGDDRRYVDELNATLSATAYCLLTIKYGPPTLPTGQGVTYNLIECDFEADTVTIPTTNLMFANGDAVTVPIAKLIPTARLIIPRAGVPLFLGTQIFGALGCINSVDFYGSNQSRTLSLGASSKQRFVPNGTQVWDYRFQFKTRSNDTSVPDFNQGWDSALPGWATYAAPLPFGSQDLNQLIDVSTI